MQQTTNYQLCQWDPEDRILREDFNSDNAKLDAALKQNTSAIASLRTFAEDIRDSVTEETASRQAAVTALEMRLGLQLLLTAVTVKEDFHTTFDISNIQWSDWRKVHLLLWPKVTNGGACRIYLNSESSGNELAVDIKSPTGLCRITLYPLFRADLPVSGEAVHGSIVPVYHESPFSRAAVLILRNNLVADEYILPGTRLEIWGEQ